VATLASRISLLSTAIGNYIRDSVKPRLLPAGGSSGQVLAKSSATDYATGWVTPGSDPWTRVGLAADAVNATVTFTDVTGWTVTVPANTNFTVECELILVAGNATTNLPRFGFTWSAALAYGVGEVAYDSSTSAEVVLKAQGLTSAGNLQMAAGTAPTTTAYKGRALLKGRTGGSAVTIKGQLAAESAAASAAQLKIGSEFRSRTGP
jgi:hypothetical protein